MTPHILVEEDRVLRLLGVVLDPGTEAARISAWRDFVAHDEPDFPAWLTEVRNAMSGLYPARLTFVADQDALRAALPDADLVVTESLRIDAAELDLAPRLRLVQKFGVIPGNVDLETCRRRGIAVAFLRRRQNIAVAEHAFAVLLSLARRLPELTGNVTADAVKAAGFDPTPFDHRFMANSNYGRVPGLRTLHESTVGVVGMGEIGREFAARCAAFGMPVLYHQRNRIPAGEEARLGASHVPLAELFERSDFVSIHLPLSDATSGIIDAAVLRHLRPGAIVVNTARAALVERSALMEALDSGRLAAYGLDTGYAEPADPADPLLGRANVLLTPHVAPASRWNGLDDIADLIGNLHRAITT